MAGEVHCWEDGDGSTCMLLDGHSGNHDFIPDNEIMVRFVPPEVFNPFTADTLHRLDELDE